MVSFNRISQIAKEYPIVTSLPPLSSFFLGDLKIYQNINSYKKDFYDPSYIFKKDVIIDTQEKTHLLPRVECTEDPFSPKLNNVINWTDLEHIKRIKNCLLTQSKIGDYITSKVTNEEVVALVILDGVSYEMLKDYNFKLKPVFVDGVSNTRLGHYRIIYGNNKQSISSKLLNKHRFRHLKGYTYWDKGQNETSDMLYKSIRNVQKIIKFEDILDDLKKKNDLDGRTYIQITRMGLDQQSHKRREEPNIKDVISRIIEDINNLKEILEEISNKFKIIVTSDHGILWRESMPDDPPIIRKKGPPRYLKRGTFEKGGIIFDESDGEKYTCFKYPYLTRNIKTNEWGFHGGLSYQESIVPYIEINGGK